VQARLLFDASLGCSTAFAAARRFLEGLDATNIPAAATFTAPLGSQRADQQRVPDIAR